MTFPTERGEVEGKNKNKLRYCLMNLLKAFNDLSIQVKVISFALTISIVPMTILEIINIKAEISLAKHEEEIKLDTIMNSFRSNFPFIKPSNMNKKIIMIKRIMRMWIKKKNINDIDALLNDNKIKYEKNDLSNVLESMSL